MSEQTVLRCASCSAPLQGGDLFCEGCGARLGDEPVLVGCHACGAPPDALGEDGYCSVCGVRERGPSSRTEVDLQVAAAVSDQGRVHRRNEDAFHLQVVGAGGVAVVVCDGISSASAGDTAARDAAAAAGHVLAQAIGDPARDPGEAILDAVRAAQDAVEQVQWTRRIDRAVPSCTLVSALCREREIVIGWVGDSRAYWIAGEQTCQLTVDDSWAEEQIAEGLLSPEEASRDSRFHSITNWVGADAPERPPRTVLLRPAGRGRLLLCTDGLWNYAPTPGELAGLIDALPDGAAAAAVARSLTETALARGGRDNITVAVIDFDPS
jgi:serine/threonine protein phosphatase PrpC